MSRRGLVGGMLVWLALVGGLIAWTRPSPAVAAIFVCQSVLLLGLAYAILGIRATNARLARLSSAPSAEPVRNAVGSLQQEISELRTSNSSAISSGGDRIIWALGKAISRSNRQLYRQFEALTNLNTMMPFDRPMPPTRGYPASPDLLLLLVDLVRQHRPSLVVECGSGTSTVWIARAIRHFGIDGRVVALEHERQYAKQTRQYIDDDELSDHADVRDAPLEMFDIAGTQWQWYASSAWKDLDNIDFVFVDGPPGSIADQARFPALPLLFEHLATDVVVVVDDLVREDERKIMAEWLATYSGFTSERVQLETGGAILRRGDQ